MSHRRHAPENAPLTAFTERSRLIDDINSADSSRVESFSSLRLAMAELSAQVASTDVKQLAMACGASQREVNDAVDPRAVITFQTNIVELRERIADCITRLQQAKEQVSATRGKLLEARQAAAATGPLERYLSGPDAVTFAGQLPEKLDRALQLSHARLSDLMGHVDELRAKASNGADTTRPPGLSLEEARLQIEAQVGPAHDALRKDIETQHRRIRALKAKLEESHKTVSPLRRQASPNRTDTAPTSEAARLQALRDELERCRTKQAQLRKLQWAYLVSQPTNIANLRSGKPLERVGEAMAFLKSTVIHFGQDLKKIKVVLRQANFDKEQIFKQAHNELKLVVGLMLPKEEQLRFQRNTNHEPWPVTDQLMETKFPAHKLDTSYVALQEMVVSWDAMTEDERQRLTTAHDVVANAEVLYVMARYVAHEWREKRVQMKIRVSGIS